MGASLRTNSGHRVARPSALFLGLEGRCDQRDKRRQTGSEGTKFAFSAGWPESEHVGDANGETASRSVSSLANHAGVACTSPGAFTPKLVRPAGQVPVRSVDAYFFQGPSISNG